MHNSGSPETTKKAPTEILRRLTFADLPAVVSIERRSFASPWSPGMFVLEMSRESSVTLAATRGDRPVAYAIFSRYEEAWHMMNVAVAPEHRRRGVGSMLIGRALELIDADASLNPETDVTVPVTLEVRPSNRSAIALYEEFDFRRYGYRKGYYPDNGEDAMIMWRGDPAAAGVPEEALSAFPGA